MSQVPEVSLEQTLAQAQSDAAGQAEFERLFLAAVVYMLVYDRDLGAAGAKDLGTTPLEFGGTKCLPLFLSAARANAFIAELKNPPHHYIANAIAVREAVAMFPGSNFLLVGDKMKRILPAQDLAIMAAPDRKTTTPLPPPTPSSAPPASAAPPVATATDWKAKVSKWFRKS